MDALTLLVFYMGIGLVLFSSAVYYAERGVLDPETGQYLRDDVRPFSCGFFLLFFGFILFGFFPACGVMFVALRPDAGDEKIRCFWTWIFDLGGMKSEIGWGNERRAAIYVRALALHHHHPRNFARNSTRNLRCRGWSLPLFPFRTRFGGAFPP